MMPSAPWARSFSLCDRLAVINTWPAPLARATCRTSSPIVPAPSTQTLDPRPTRPCRTAWTSYYWSTYQSEWAIDISFRKTAVASPLPPTASARHDDLRQHRRPAFPGRRIPLSGDHLPKRFAGEVVSDLHERQERVRIKHRLHDNPDLD